MNEVSLKELLEAGSHFGHQTVRWNPKMRPYIFDSREGVHIFDLAKTKAGLDESMAVVLDIISKGGKILFVGTKRQAKDIVEKTAKEVGMPYVTQRWLGGTLTNFEEIKKRVTRMTEIKRAQDAGEYKDEYTKREQLLFEREREKLVKFFGGLLGLDELPEAIFVVDVKREQPAVFEAKRRGVKVIGIVDTNSDPDLIDYVIPANDDAQKSIELLVSKIGEAVSEGIEEANKPEAKKAREDAKAEKDRIAAETAEAYKTRRASNQDAQNKAQTLRKKNFTKRQ